MIRTLRKKFTVTAMIAVTVLLLLILGAINGVNAWSSRRETDRQLDMLSEQVLGRRGRETPPARERAGALGPLPEGEALMTAQYYVVYPDADGLLSEVDSHLPYGSAAEALALLEQTQGRDEGRADSFRFRVLRGEDGAVRAVLLLYTGLQTRGLLRLALLSLLGFALGWGLMLLLVMFLSKKAIEPVARNMEKQKRFVTDAGHELKTPLAIIRANTEAMELTQGETKYSRNILQQVQRLTGLTQNLLALARADESRTVPDAAELDLSALAEESVLPFREPAELRGLSLSAQIAPAVTVRGSRQQLGQLIGILLDNAVKYTDEGGRIAVSLTKEGGRALLRVRNTAADRSVPPERFFDRFYRADSARTQAGGGYGIGLSAARAIAEGHRGSLSAAYEGGDIVFTLKL